LRSKLGAEGPQRSGLGLGQNIWFCISRLWRPENVHAGRKLMIESAHDIVSHREVHTEQIGLTAIDR
jgi:hypothetical protein